MSDDTADLIKKAVLGLAWGALAIVVGLLTHIVLLSIAKPYWIAGDRIVTGNETYRTYLVVNPGPWKTRTPTVEFMPDTNAALVGLSPGVTVEARPNKVCVRPDDGLPPGCGFFLTYRRTGAASADVLPSVVCDGKPCKNAPSFDLELILKGLLAGGCLLFVGFLIAGYMYWRTRRDLVYERATLLRRAVVEMIAKRAAAGMADEAERDVGIFKAEVEKFLKAMKPQTVNKRKGNNKGGAAGKGAGTP